jgi:DNA-binding transcriptional ArsR family regulator
MTSMAPEECDLLCLDLEKAEAIRGALPPADDLGRIATRARALGDPTRLSLASSLAATDELCVCDLAWIVSRPLNLVSHHLRALRDAGLARTRRQHKIVYYSLTEEGRELVAGFTSAEPVHVA